MATRKMNVDSREAMPSLRGVPDFLAQLSVHNDRDWFMEHKDLYLQVKAQVEEFTAWIVARMVSFDKDMALVDPKKCVYRIYRDVRFSHDKRPYKDYIGIGISKLGRHGHCSGYYIHLQPGASMFGAGVYGLPPETLKKVRDGIYFQSAAFRKILQSEDVMRLYDGKMEEAARMKLPPKGYDKDFPDIDLLKYRYYFLERPVSDAQVVSDGFAAEVLTGLEAAFPFNKFLNDAIDF